MVKPEVGNGQTDEGNDAQPPSDTSNVVVLSVGEGKQILDEFHLFFARVKSLHKETAWKDGTS